MSRVDEAQQKSAADAERLQKQQDRQTRDAKKTQESQQKFGDLVKAGVSKQQQAQEGQLSKELSRQQGQEAVQQHLGKAGEAARNARLARGGVLHHSKLMEQAKSFQGLVEADGAIDLEQKGIAGHVVKAGLGIARATR